MAGGSLGRGNLGASTLGTVRAGSVVPEAFLTSEQQLVEWAPAFNARLSDEQALVDWNTTDALLTSETLLVEWSDSGRADVTALHALADWTPPAAALITSEQQLVEWGYGDASGSSSATASSTATGSVEQREGHLPVAYGGPTISGREFWQRLFGPKGPTQIVRGKAKSTATASQSANGTVHAGAFAASEARPEETSGAQARARATAKRTRARTGAIAVGHTRAEGRAGSYRAVASEGTGIARAFGATSANHATAFALCLPVLPVVEDRSERIREFEELVLLFGSDPDLVMLFSEEA